MEAAALISSTPRLEDAGVLRRCRLTSMVLAATAWLGERNALSVTALVKF